ncbi:MAG: hypothetical protein QOG53_3479 [Frankiales bacterium]|nr:hypothetical protein [Frankiales bacterium]
MTTNSELNDFWAVARTHAFDAPASPAKVERSAGRTAAVVLLVLLTVPPTLASVISPLFLIPAGLLGVGFFCRKGSPARITLFSITAVLDLAVIAFFAFLIVVFMSGGLQFG